MKNKPWTKQELDLLQEAAKNLNTDAEIIYEVSKKTERTAAAIANKLWQMRKNESQYIPWSLVKVFHLNINETQLELILQKRLLLQECELHVYDTAGTLVGTLQVTV